MSLLQSLRAAVQKSRDYRRTLFELRGIPVSLAEDLDIYPGDAKRIARRAVYGA